jgi:hypothetical protein
VRLTELEPRCIRYETRVEKRTFCLGDVATWKDGDPTEERVVPVRYEIRVDSFSEAQGIVFLCPLCFAKNSGSVGTHWCSVSFAERGVSSDEGTHNSEGSPVRWNVSGDSFDNLSTTPSILLQGGCNWHGYITNGEVQ